MKTNIEKQVIPYKIIRRNSQYNKYIKWFCECYREDGSLLSSFGYKTERKARAMAEKKPIPFPIGDRLILTIYEEVKRGNKMKSKKEIVKLIIKKDKYGLIAFYVEDQVNRGCVASMTLEGGHCEASIGYYSETRKPSDKEVKEFITDYEKLYDCKVERRYRLTYEDCEKMWEWLKRENVGVAEK